MKLLVELANYEILNKVNDQYIWGFLIGETRLSLSSAKNFSLTKIKSIIKIIHNRSQKVVLNCGKMFTPSEIVTLKEVISNFNKMGIDYFWYTDMAIKVILDDLDIAHKGYYEASTYMTNARDINIMLNENSFVCASPEISYEENVLIAENVIKPYSIYAFGALPLFTSRRNLITSYKQYLGKRNKAKKGYIVEEYRHDKYPIEEDKNGTQIYLEGYYALTKELETLKDVHHIIVLTKFLNEEENIMVINAYLDYIKQKISCEKLLEKLNQLSRPLSTSLLYQKSILIKNEL